MRVILVTGKGGVGKTTLAAATALSAADSGSRTLLVSTDAAHSVADILERPIGVEPARVTDHLDAVQLDARYELQRSWASIAGYLRLLLGSPELDSLRIDELVVIPGLDQLLALARLHALASDPTWDAIVVDCAPSADSLRLLMLPEVLRWYLDRLLGTNGTIAKWSRRRFERSFAIPLPDDSVLSSVQGMAQDLARLRGVLHDASTTARVVVTPQKLAVSEAQRTISYLSLYGYAIDAVLVNKVRTSEAPASADAASLVGEDAQLRAIAEGFAFVPRLTAPARTSEPLGLAALRGLGREVYGEGPALARLTTSQHLEFTQCGGQPVVRILLPGARREDIALDVTFDQLIITLGEHRRTIRLPDALTGRRVQRAGLRDGHLEVFFSESIDA